MFQKGCKKIYKKCRSIIYASKRLYEFERKVIVAGALSLPQHQTIAFVIFVGRKVAVRNEKWSTVKSFKRATNQAQQEWTRDLVIKKLKNSSLSKVRFMVQIRLSTSPLMSFGDVIVNHTMKKAEIFVSYFSKKQI